MHKLAFSKINPENENSIRILKSYAESLLKDKPVKYESFHYKEPNITIHLLEMYYSFAETYINLSKLFGNEIFEDSEKVALYREELSSSIQSLLNIDSDNLFGFKFGQNGNLDIFN